jgi:hypothetical protein
MPSWKLYGALKWVPTTLAFHATSTVMLIRDHAASGSIRCQLHFLSSVIRSDMRTTGYHYHWGTIVSSCASCYVTCLWCFLCR